MSNPEYTRLWTEQFSANAVLQYDRKFHTRWEKNIKHREQIAFVDKYLEDWMYWCDCPIGSGRLMDELQTSKMLGFDISESFIEYNKKRGIPCVKGDIFSFGEQFSDEFDFITSLHTIFAFIDYQKILVDFVKALKVGGMLVVDLTNKPHSQYAPDLKPLLVNDPSKYPDGMTRKEINQFFDEHDCDVLEIQPHDFWDNYFILRWRRYPGGWIKKKIRNTLWTWFNEAYFAFGLYDVLHRFEFNQPDYRFTKYLVAVKKR